MGTLSVLCCPCRPSGFPLGQAVAFGFQAVAASGAIVPARPADSISCRHHHGLERRCRRPSLRRLGALCCCGWRRTCSASGACWFGWFMGTPPGRFLVFYLRRSCWAMHCWQPVWQQLRRLPASVGGRSRRRASRVPDVRESAPPGGAQLVLATSFCSRGQQFLPGENQRRIDRCAGIAAHSSGRQQQRPATGGLGSGACCAGPRLSFGRGPRLAVVSHDGRHHDDP